MMYGGNGHDHVPRLDSDLRSHQDRTRLSRDYHERWPILTWCRRRALISYSRTLLYCQNGQKEGEYHIRRLQALTRVVADYHPKNRTIPTQ